MAKRRYGSGAIKLCSDVLNVDSHARRQVMG